MQAIAKLKLNTLFGKYSLPGGRRPPLTSLIVAQLHEYTLLAPFNGTQGLSREDLNSFGSFSLISKRPTQGGHFSAEDGSSQTHRLPALNVHFVCANTGRSRNDANDPGCVKTRYLK